MGKYDEWASIAFSFFQSRPQTPPSHEEKQSGEPSRISWASMHFCDSVTQQRSKYFVDNPLKKVRILKWDEQILMLQGKWYCNLVVLYRFWVISPRNSTSFTRVFLAGRCAWAGQETRHFQVVDCDAPPRQPRPQALLQKLEKGHTCKNSLYVHAESTYSVTAHALSETAWQPQLHTLLCEWASPQLVVGRQQLHFCLEGACFRFSLPQHYYVRPYQYIGTVADMTNISLPHQSKSLCLQFVCNHSNHSVVKTTNLFLQCNTTMLDHTNIQVQLQI